MTQDQINRNFIAMNEWMKLERKERDKLRAEYERLARSFAIQEQLLQTMRGQMNLLLAQHFHGGATVE